MTEGATIPAGDGLISYYTQYAQFGQFRNGKVGLKEGKRKNRGRG